MTWYDQGYSGVDREEERKENMYGPGRLYLPPGSSRDLVFVDDDPSMAASEK